MPQRFLRDRLVALQTALIEWEETDDSAEWVIVTTAHFIRGQITALLECADLGFDIRESQVDSLLQDAEPFLDVVNA